MHKITQQPPTIGSGDRNSIQHAAAKLSGHQTKSLTDTALLTLQHWVKVGIVIKGAVIGPF